jgi:hypothetical protein
MTSTALTIMLMCMIALYVFLSPGLVYLWRRKGSLCTSKRPSLYLIIGIVLGIALVFFQDNQVIAVILGVASFIVFCAIWLAGGLFTALASLSAGYLVWANATVLSLTSTRHLAVIVLLWVVSIAINEAGYYTEDAGGFDRFIR